MRIKDVEKRTGLTRKTVRFYEEKGLLRIRRSENTYREYDEADIQRLLTISVLRKAGVSVTDIQLWLDEVISLDEMMQKHLCELKGNAELAHEQIQLCHSILSVSEIALLAKQPAEESEQISTSSETLETHMLCLGIDVGTTSISSVVLDLTDSTSLATYTITSHADILSKYPYEKCQDVHTIEDRVQRLVDALLARFPRIASIGFTGQMHGILYLDGKNKPCSPLYTWQDNRAGQGNSSTCALIREKTGLSIAPGYGLATHYHLQLHGQLPKEARKIATVMDYLAWKFSDFSKPIMHATNAASLGLFRDGKFEDLDKLGIAPSLLPEVTNEREILGFYRGIPISVAIGDNQASFFGSVQNPSTMVLANFGTGSQISLMAPNNVTPGAPEIEIRPYGIGTCLQSGSALCGGRAYAILEHFIRELLGTQSEQYAFLNRLASEGLSHPLSVQTTFCGTRGNPDLRGTISGIGEDNFTPQALAAGVLIGMAQELHQMYQCMKSTSITTLIASGNAVRKNPALRKALEAVFRMPLLCPKHTEEAAYGAAMFSALAAKLAKPSEISEKCIHYLSFEEEKV